MSTESDNGSLEQTRSFAVLSPGTEVSHYRIIEKRGAARFKILLERVKTQWENFEV